MAAVAGAALAADPCEPTGASNSSAALHSWMGCTIDRFFPFPGNEGWDVAYDDVFSSDLRASFNHSRFDKSGFKSMYHTLNTTIGAAFGVHGFRHEMTTMVAVPNEHDKGGFVFYTGMEGGTTIIGTTVWLANGAMLEIADVNGKRQIIELREATNVPFSGHPTGVKNWTCAF
jgi:hypothetical protein